jgi:EAL domain-containing protein (putative c-di-GMP-specific phosphodiesterase class I)
VRHRNGTWLYVETIATSLLHDPAVHGIVLNSHDVSERHQLEEQLKHQAFHDDLTVPIGQFVLEESCRQLKRWQTEVPGCQPLALSVNLSARQFQHPSLVDDIARLLREFDLDPGMLRLELTESVVMEDAEAITDRLRALKKLGTKLVIDDFGTGYSSLSYLSRFSIDALKIDRSFVAKMAESSHDLAIVQGIIALAKSLMLSVTGEGIEQVDQLEQLRALGCDRGQGYYFSKPLPADAVASALTSITCPRPGDGALTKLR